MHNAPSTVRSAREEQLAIERLLAQSELLPLLPMIYVAWADGELEDEEIARVVEQATRLNWLDTKAATMLADWLDPSSPPSPAQLQMLLEAIEARSPELDHPERIDLAEFGLEIARAQGVDRDAAWNENGVRKALASLEAALGLVGSEATRELLADAEAGRRITPVPRSPAPAFDREAMTRLLDGRHHEVRCALRDLLASERLEFAYGLDLDAHRELVTSWVRVLADEGYGERCYPPFDERTGARDMSEFLAMFETLGYFDLNLPVKFGVQFGLFGGSIYFLGGKRHHERYLPRIARLELAGCYAMTEMGRGSNVRDLETTATFDAASGEFVIHTPSESARKEWIGGAGRYATMATVFAQLIVGGENYGVHALLVPIRDEHGEPLPGVRLEDMGHKMGLNGIDNGRIWFDHVRVPRENLLDRFGKVTAEGRYLSAIPSSNRRFFTMLSTLVAGRLGVAAAGLSATKTALAIAVRYGAMRRQFGPAGKPEIPILDYRMHQRQLMPALATAYALSFAMEAINREYNDHSRDNRREVEAKAAGIKAYSSWNAVATIQAARECCGGQGYLSINRLAGLRTDVDVFVTFEGANMVMMQQVAKARLTEYGQELSDANFFTLARFLARQATARLSETNPVVTRNTDVSHLRDPEFQLSALRYRENDLVVGVARRIKRRIDDGMDSFDAFNDCQDHVIALARAYTERVVLESFTQAVERCEDAHLGDQLTRLRDLYALSLIEKDIGWFLENDYVQSNKAAAIRDQVNRLCAEVREQAVHLVDAFGIPDRCLSAPIAFGDGKEPAESRPEFARGVAKG